MPMISGPPAFSGFINPEQAKSQRARAGRLMDGGMSTEPVGHWTQGLARVLQGINGVRLNEETNHEEARAMSKAAEDSAAYHAMPDGDRAARTKHLTGMLANPYAAPFAQRYITRENDRSMLLADREEQRKFQREEREADRKLRQPLINAQVAAARARAGGGGSDVPDEWVALGNGRSMNRRSGVVRDHNPAPGASGPGFESVELDDDGVPIFNPRVQPAQPANPAQPAPPSPRASLAPPTPPRATPAAPAPAFLSGPPASLPAASTLRVTPAAPSPAPVDDPAQMTGFPPHRRLSSSGVPVSPADDPTQPAAPAQPRVVRAPLPPPMRLGGPKPNGGGVPGRNFSPPVPLRVSGGEELGGEDPEQTTLPPDDAPYSKAGVTSPQVPGIVTNSGPSRRTDIEATRAAAGTQAVAAAPEAQRQAALKHRKYQDYWTWAHGKPAQPGHYYSPDGRQVPMTDRIYKGDREQRAVADLHLKSIDENLKKALEPSWAGRVIAGAADSDALGGAVSAAAKPLAALFNTGDTAQAFSNLKQSALGIAYLLSGKQVAVKEMENFVNAYAPMPGDSEHRATLKANAMKKFYGALIGLNREVDENDVRRAAAAAAMPAGANPATAAPAAPPTGSKDAGDGFSWRVK